MKSTRNLWPILLASMSVLPAWRPLAAAGPHGLSAKWIWREQPDYNVYNQTIVARKSFSLSLDQAQRAVLRITADSFYRLYVNDQWVNDGPVPQLARAFSIRRAGRHRLSPAGCQRAPRRRAVLRGRGFPSRPEAGGTAGTTGRDGARRQAGSDHHRRHVGGGRGPGLAAATRPRSASRWSRPSGTTRGWPSRCSSLRRGSCSKRTRARGAT